MTVKSVSAAVLFVRYKAGIFDIYDIMLENV